MSPAGVEFIKCATSAPDFDQASCEGVPDLYNGKTVVKNDFLTTTSFAAPGTDTYLLFAPTPGVAVWACTVAAGAALDGATFTPVLFPDAAQMFPNAIANAVAGQYVSNTESVDKFRHVALAGEVICLQNDFSYAGSVTTWRTPLDLVTGVVPLQLGGVDAAETQYVTGVDGIGPTELGSQVFTESIKQGSYTCSLNKDAVFSFRDIRDGEALNSETSAPLGSPASGTSLCTFTGPMLGMGTCDTIVTKLSVPVGAANQSYQLRAWQCVEYQAVMSSMLHQFAHLSPDYDLVALEAYKHLAANLPIAVTSAQNARFWATVLRILHGSSGLLAGLPGPWGEIARGVHAATSMARG